MPRQTAQTWQAHAGLGRSTAWRQSQQRHSDLFVVKRRSGVELRAPGFDVVLQPAQTTYLDMTQDYAPEEPGVDWANPLPLEKLTTMNHSLKCQQTIQYVNAFGAFKQHCGAKSSTTSLVWTTWSSRA